MLCLHTQASKLSSWRGQLQPRNWAGDCPTVSVAQCGTWDSIQSCSTSAWKRCRCSIRLGLCWLRGSVLMTRCGD